MENQNRPMINIGPQTNSLLDSYDDVTKLSLRNQLFNISHLLQARFISAWETPLVKVQHFNHSDDAHMAQHY